MKLSSLGHHRFLVSGKIPRFIKSGRLPTPGGQLSGAVVGISIFLNDAAALVERATVGTLNRGLVQNISVGVAAHRMNHLSVRGQISVRRVSARPHHMIGLKRGGIAVNQFLFLSQLILFVVSRTRPFPVDVEAEQTVERFIEFGFCKRKFPAASVVTGGSPTGGVC